jgi:hypothetical protein
MSIFSANNIGLKGLQIDNIIEVSERNKRVKAQSLLTNDVLDDYQKMM